MGRANWGYLLLGLASAALLWRHYFIIDQFYREVFAFSSILIICTGILLIFQFDQIIFDNREWEKNTSLASLVKKIRLRAVLFSNLSVIIFVIIVLIIFLGFYILVNPQYPSKAPLKPEESITIRVGATALLIFLVQILFRAFKYLLRVAAFYNGKADAIETNALIEGSDLSKLMDMFTPDKYDISDVQTPSFLDKITGK